MTKPIIRIVELDGTVIDRELTDAEFTAYQADNQRVAQRAAEAEAKADAKAAAQSKLAALGLTVDDLQALGL